MKSITANENSMKESTMKSTQILTTAKLLLAILVFSFLASGMAAAQSTWKGTFQLNDELRWGTAVLSPGSYTLTIESAQMPMVAMIRSANGKTVAFATTSISNDLISKNSSILIVGTGAQRQVRSLNLPLLGLSLEYRPTTVKENEEFSKLKTETVAVRSVRGDHGQY